MLLFVVPEHIAKRIKISQLTYFCYKRTMTIAIPAMPLLEAHFGGFFVFANQLTPGRGDDGCVSP